MSDLKKVFGINEVSDPATIKRLAQTIAPQGRDVADQGPGPKGWKKKDIGQGITLFWDAKHWKFGTYDEAPTVLDVDVSGMRYPGGKITGLEALTPEAKELVAWANESGQDPGHPHVTDFNELI